MNILRRASTRQLLIAIVVVIVIAAGSAVAFAGGGGPKPPQRSLAAALHHAATAKPVQGVTARVKFTDHLIPSGSLGSSSPLITGATGRVWAGNGKLRLELQSSAGDTEIGFDGSKVTVYDVSKGTAYTMAVPRHEHARHERPPPPRRSERGQDPAGAGQALPARRPERRHRG